MSLGSISGHNAFGVCTRSLFIGGVVYFDKEEVRMSLQERSGQSEEDNLVRSTSTLPIARCLSGLICSKLCLRLRVREAEEGRCHSDDYIRVSPTS